tara:strand:- start:9 stop:953 length:945 start_codon:yes stop_codon:yes gene_type:complete
MPSWKKIVASGSAADLSSLTLDTPLAIAEGGTGATTAAGVRTAIGLGTAATRADSYFVQPADTFYIGTTQIAHNSDTGALTLAGITLTTPDIGTPSAGVATNLSGTASGLTAGTATVANTVKITDNEATNEANLITFAADAGDTTGTHGLEMDGNLTYNPATSLLTVGYLATTVGRKLELPSNSASDWRGADIVYFGTGEDLTSGTIYHYVADGEGGGAWTSADADAESTAKGMLAVALGSTAADGMLLKGMVTLDHDPGAIGDVLYLSTTAGDATSTAPSGNADIIRIIGYCLAETDGIIYFDPDKTFVEVTA